jgi:phosphoglycerol transferase MdoB-like AlkP superfamily enzyme
VVTTCDIKDVECVVFLVFVRTSSLESFFLFRLTIYMMLSFLFLLEVLLPQELSNDFRPDIL